MSRNYELLQRIEQERKNNSGFPRIPLPDPDQPNMEVAHDQGIGGEIVSCDSPIKRISLAQKEEVRKLVNRLFILPAMEAPRMVVFAGIDQENGSSAIASCAAQLLAEEAAKNVCLVDVSCHSPAIHKHFGIATDPGLTSATQALDDGLSYLRRVSEYLWVMPAGGSKTRRCRGEDMVSVLSGLRSRFEFVLLHSAPLAVDEDALITGELWDGVALVLEANATRRAAAQAVKSMLEAANVRVLGAVLNNRRYPIPQSIYSRL